MATLQPIYTRGNCRFSAPLKWSATVFWREQETESNWLDDLKQTTESDGIRILSHRFHDHNTSQFAISTTPEVSPQSIVQRLKGRLYFLVKSRLPKPFRRKFSIRSIGQVTRETVEQYVADQLGHHQMADPEVQRRLANYQINDSSADLAEAQRTSHGVYWYNLHVVLVHQERWIDVDHDRLNRVQSTLDLARRKHGLRLSRAGILPDHVHLAIGCSFEMPPIEIVLMFLNNLAYVYEMKPVFQFGGWIGTFGEYTTNAF